MAELDINTTKAVDLGIKDYSVNSKSLDAVDEYSDEVYWDYPFTQRNQGYYKEIPELKKAIDGLAMWTIGKGFVTDTITKVDLDHIRGNGKDTFQSVLWNLMINKKLNGDSFAEIVREGDRLVNLKPISAERIRIVFNKSGIIKRYEQKTSNGKKTFKPEQILHLQNDRVGDEIHGTSVVDACKWVIDARNEAMTDYRKVLHRNVVPVRIIEIDTQDTSKRDNMMAQYKEAIQKGEVLVIPKGTVEIKQDTISIQDPITWIQYLENFFYQAVGIPKIILGGSEQFTEASSKVGYLTFEQVYISEQRELEEQIYAQLGIKIKFERPVSLKDTMQQSEAANTGQVGFQPKESGVNLQRE